MVGEVVLVVEGGRCERINGYFILFNHAFAERKGFEQKGIGIVQGREFFAIHVGRGEFRELPVGENGDCPRWHGIHGFEHRRLSRIFQAVCRVDNGDRP